MIPSFIDNVTEKYANAFFGSRAKHSNCVRAAIEHVEPFLEKYNAQIILGTVFVAMFITQPISTTSTFANLLANGMLGHLTAKYVVPKLLTEVVALEIGITDKGRDPKESYAIAVTTDGQEVVQGVEQRVKMYA